MKKLMMAVAIVCAAVGAQAAQINWVNLSSDSPIWDLDGNKLTAQNASDYAFKIFLVDYEGNTVGDSASIGSMTAGGLSGATYTYTYVAREATDSYVKGQYKSGDTFSILAKMTVDDTNYEMKFGSFTITASNDTGTDEFVWSSGTYGGLSAKGTAGSAASWSAAAVPEPTSGLLLALGLAGLALKRKRA